MGNIFVNEELMSYFFAQVLPQLYSLDIFSLKFRNGFGYEKLFLPLSDMLNDYPDCSILIRLRISHINLRK